MHSRSQARSASSSSTCVADPQVTRPSVQEVKSTHAADKSKSGSYVVLSYNYTPIESCSPFFFLFMLLLVVRNTLLPFLRIPVLLDLDREPRGFRLAEKLNNFLCFTMISVSISVWNWTFAGVMLVGVACIAKIK